MKQNQKIRINKTGTEIINALNTGANHEQYSGKIICKSPNSPLWLIEIDQPGVDTLKMVKLKAGSVHTTDKAFILLPEIFFEAQ